MKKNFKRTLAALLCAVMLLGSVASGGEGFAETFNALSIKSSAETSGIFTYEIINEEVKITGSDEFAGGDIIIPSTIDGYPVTVIGERAFRYRTNITSVNIPYGVTQIEDSAFLGCTNLAEIKIPSGLTYLGGNAFSDTAFYNDETNWESDILYFGSYLIAAKMDFSGAVTIKNGTRLIGGDAFYNCTGVTSIAMPSSVETICSYAFAYCTGVTNITIPNSVTKIGYYAFGEVNNIRYSDSMTATGSPWGAVCVNGYIDGSLVYSDSSKTELINCHAAAKGSVVIPSSVASIKETAFEDCTGLTEITVNSSNSSYSSDSYGVLFNKDKTELIRYPVGNKRTSYTIPGSVECIYDNAFNGGGNLVGLTIPDSVTSIGYDSFRDVKNIIYSDNLMSSGSPWGAENVNGYVDGFFVYADSSKKILYKCSLAAGGNINIPNSVTSISSHAFDSCTEITSINLPNSIVTIGDFVFSDCTGLTELSIPQSVVKIGSGAFYECTGLKTMNIPANVKSIGKGIFALCSGLTSVSLPDSISEISSSAFTFCTSLSAISIPDSVKTIGDYAFHNCTNLSSIVIPENVSYIGEEAFSFCSGLKNVVISDNSNTDIGEAAFALCDILEYVHIPSSVTDIGEQILYQTNAYICSDSNNCYAKTYADENNYRFNTCLGHSHSGIFRYTIKNGKATIIECDTAASGNITIPASIDGYPVNSIGDNAFENCKNITGITIPDGVTEIGDFAFVYCTGLTSVTMPAGVINIGNCAFSYCKNLETITIPENVQNLGYGVFGGCSELSAINVNEKNKYFSSDSMGVLFNKDKTKLIQYPIACSKEEYTVPAGVKIIGDSAFYCSKVLKSIILPDSVVEIDNGSFAGCSALEYVHIPSTVSTIGNVILHSEADNPCTAYICSDSNNCYAKTYANENGYPFKACSGHASQPKTYTVTYNANGGTGAPAAQVKTEKVALTLSTAKPSKTDCTFLGWATSNTATSAEYQPGASYTNDASVTLYAVWEAASSGFNSSNRYSFSNSSSNFVTTWSDGCYYMSDSDMTKLANYIEHYDSNAKSTLSSVQRLQKSRWGGSCYGMATTAILDYNGAIAFNENFGGASSMQNVKSPKTDKSVMSAINYYMVAQAIGFVRNESAYYSSSSSNWSTGLNSLVSAAKKGEPFLFCYFFSGGGHAIVAYDYKLESNGTHSIIAYDNRFPSNDIIISVDKNYTSCTVKTPNANEACSAIEFDTSMAAFDKIDIDGPANDMNIKYSSYSYNNDNTEIQVLADGDVTVTDKSGKTITISDGIIGGSMNIISTHMIVNSTADGGAAPVTFVFEVADSQQFTFESTSDNMAISVKTDNMFASASADNADYIVVESNEGVSILGENIGYTASLSSRNNLYDTVSLVGSSDDDVSLTYDAKNNITANGVDGSSDTITVYSDVTNITDYNFASGYESIAIAQGSNGNIGIFSTGSGTGSQDIKASADIAGYVANRTLDYKSTITFNAKLTAEVKGASVHWFVNGSDVASGNSYTITKATSDFNIQARLIKDGNVISESKVEAVTVKHGFFDKIIAFFKGLFGALPVIEQK